MLVMAALIFSAFTALTEADDSQFSLRGSDVDSKDTYDRDDYDRKNWDKDKKDDYQKVTAKKMTAIAIKKKMVVIEKKTMLPVMKLNK